MRNRRSAWLAALAAVAFVALAGCGSGGDSSGVRGGAVRVALNNTNDSLAVVVAEKQGFFTRHGVTVTTTTLNDISLVPSLLGKQYDIGFSVAPIMIQAAAAGVPLVAVSGNNGDSPESQNLQIFTRPGATDVSQLQGKRIGAPTLTGNLNIATKAWLSASGVDPAREQFVQVATPNMLDQLKGGRVDAVELIQPFISIARQEGLTSLGDPERVLGNGYVGSTYWTASRSWATANAATVSGFRAALSDADQWIKDNPQAAYQTSADYTKVSLAQAQQTPLTSYTVDVSADDLKVWGDAMAKVAGFGGKVDYNSLVYTGQ
jgi:NitT/TauT family transport system substrate-binding protein